MLFAQGLWAPRLGFKLQGDKQMNVAQVEGVVVGAGGVVTISKQQWLRVHPPAGHTVALICLDHEDGHV